MDSSLQNFQNEQKNPNDQEKKAKDYANQQEQVKNSILSSVLDQQARARLSNISLAKPDKGKALENMIVQMAQYGRIPCQLSEEQLIKLLEQLNQQQKPKSTVKFERRRVDDDSDDDDD